MSSRLRFAAPGAFARDVAARGRALLRRHGGDRFADAAQWGRAAAIALLGFAAYAALLAGWETGPLAPAAILLAALAAFLLVAQLGHDAAHGTLAARPAVNRAALGVCFGILGIDGGLWRDRHLRLHHHYANLPGTGIDADSVQLMRLAPDKPWRPWHRLQPLYAPLLYLLGHATLVWWEDFALLRTAPPAHRRGGALAAFAAGKLLHAALFLLLPWLLLAPPLHLLAFGYLLASAVVSAAFALLVIGTHVSDLAAFPQPDPDGRLAQDWATHQLDTSVDWAPADPLVAAITGGANAHVAHHLFPNVSHRHLPMLSRLISERVAAHGLRHRVTSFAGLVAGHWRLLVALARRPTTSLPHTPPLAEAGP